MTTDTETLLLDFPYQPLWTNVYVRNKARATVPLLWSRVQVCKMQIYKLLDYPNPIADFLLVNPFLSLTYLPTAFLFILCFFLSFFTCFYINFEILFVNSKYEWVSSTWTYIITSSNKHLAMKNKYWGNWIIWSRCKLWERESNVVSPSYVS